MALGIWEPYVTREFRPQLGDTVVDIGAHIGFYTLMASKAVGPQGKVIAIEPDPRNLSILRQNICANNLRNVKLVNCAIGSFQGSTDLQMKGNPLLSELAMEKKQDNECYIEVAVKTLDSLCKDLKIENVDWIKIDVENGALDVLKGAFETINRKTRILIEVPDDETLQLLEENRLKPRKLLQSPSKYGYYIASHNNDLENKYAFGQGYTTKDM
ncbi:MAG: FkbM family methyltransferase [Candidatus Thorarchaeota archaeon]